MNTTLRVSFGFMLFAAVLFAGCEKLAELTKFDIPLSTKFTIPANSLVNTLITIPTPDIPTNADKIFDSNKTDTDLITSIKLKSMAVSINTPTAGTFKFLKNIEIWIKAGTLAETKLAYNSAVPAIVGNTLTVQLGDVDFKQYLTQNNVSFRIAFELDEAITEDYEIKLEPIFVVDAEILGQ